MPGTPCPPVCILLLYCHLSTTSAWEMVGVALMSAYGEKTLWNSGFKVN